jgi:5-methylcytosine-specific restriction endonuclease McrA
VIREAVDVHHKLKPDGDLVLFYSIKNLMSLCKSCHSKRTQRGE